MIEARQVSYGWAGTPNSSVSQKSVNDEVVTTNWVTNPNANGSSSSFGTAATPTAHTMGSRPRAYKATATSLPAGFGLSTAQQPAASAGQEWWARARVQADSTVLGGRTLSVNCQFLDAVGGNVLDTKTKMITTAPAGTFRRWTGTANASTSEEYTGTSKRTNFALSPKGTANLVPNGSGAVLTPNVSLPVPSPNGTTVGARFAWQSGTSQQGIRFDGPPPASSIVAISMMVYVESGTVNNNGLAPVLSGVAGGTSISAPVGQWVQVNYTVTNNTGTGNQVGIRWGGTTPDSGSLLVTDVMVETVGSTSQAAGPFFDGSSVTPVQGKYHAWSGSANNSASVERSPDGSTRVNLASDPAATSFSLSSGALGWASSRWFGSGGNGNYSLVTGASDAPAGLSTYARKTWAVASTSSGDTGFNLSPAAGGFPVIAGETYSISAYLRASTAHGTSSIQIKWYKSDGTALSANGYDVAGANTVLPAGTWSRQAATVTVPASAAAVVVMADIDGNEAWPVGATLDGTGLLVEKSSTVGSYFDGSTTNSSLVLPTGTDTSIYDVSVSGIAPSGTKAASLVVTRHSGNAASGDIIWMTDVALEQNSAEYPATYFDGDFSDETIFVNVERPDGITTDEWIEVDGTPLNTLAWNITTWGGNRLSPPAVRGSNVTVPGRPGTVFMEKEVDSQTYTLNMWVQGSLPDGSRPTERAPQEEFDANWRMLRKLLFTTRRLLKVTKRWYDPDLNAILSAVGYGHFNGGLEPSMTGRARAIFSVDLLFPDPFFYGATQEFDPSTTATKTWRPDVMGDWRTTSIQASITGPRVNPKITVTHPDGSQVWVQYSGTLATGDVLNLDVDKFTAKLTTAAGVTSSVTGLIKHGGDAPWLTFEPGENVVVLSSTSGTGAVTLSYNPVWF